MSALFEPLQLRSVTLPNRIVLSPMCQYSATDGVPNGWHRIHLGRYAAAGLGLIIAEATHVSPQGRITPGCLGLYIKRGLVRTFQVTSLFPALTPLQSVALAICEREGLTGRWHRPLGDHRAALDEAAEILQRLRLGAVAQRETRLLAYGQQRILEVAVALAARPRVLLLDEPAAGIPAAESGADGIRQSRPWRLRHVRGLCRRRPDAACRLAVLGQSAGCLCCGGGDQYCRGAPALPASLSPQPARPGVVHHRTHLHGYRGDHVYLRSQPAAGAPARLRRNCPMCFPRAGICISR